MFKFASQMVKNKVVGGMLLAVFLSVLSLSLFHMPAVGMDMSGDTSGCPFMAHEATLCSMSVLDHVGAWKSAFLAVVPGFTLLLSVLVGAIVLLSVAPNLLVKQKYRTPPLPKKLTERTYTFSYRPLQELFSSGILHPKLF